MTKLAGFWPKVHKSAKSAKFCLNLPFFAFILRDKILHIFKNGKSPTFLHPVSENRQKDQPLIWNLWKKLDPIFDYIFFFGTFISKVGLFDDFMTWCKKAYGVPPMHEFQPCVKIAKKTNLWYEINEKKQVSKKHDNFAQKASILTENASFSQNPSIPIINRQF